MQQNIAFLYLVNPITRKVGIINIALEHLSLETTSERLEKKEALFDCWDKS